jgi:Protein of unknown function (DUF664)
MTTARENEKCERADLIETLGKHRAFLRYTVKGLSDEQAARRPTASDLCLGGLIKHVTLVEAQWADFIRRGTAAVAMADAAALEGHANSFRMLPGETVSVLLDRYETVARSTEALVNDLPSLEISHPLPEAPWFEPGGDGRLAGFSCISWPRRLSTPATPTSSGSPSTRPRPWADAPSCTDSAECRRSWSGDVYGPGRKDAGATDC